MRLSAVRIILFGVFAVGLTVVQPVSAQDGPLKVPNLTGHRFIASSTVADPFVSTHIENGLGAGSAVDLAFPLFEVGGDTVFAPRGDVLFALLNFQYQQKIKSWLAVHGRFRTVGRLGTDAQSLFSVGVTASSMFEFGWLIALHRSDRSALSLDLGFRRVSTTLVDIFGFIEDVTNREDASLVQSVPAVQGVAGVRYAHGFSSILGIQLEGQILYGEETQARGGDNQLHWQLGAAVSIDPRESHKIPIGFLAAYSFRTLTLGFRDADTESQEFEVKLVYTATTDFDIGPAFAVSRLPGTYQDTVTLISITMGSRYYF